MSKIQEISGQRYVRAIIGCLTQKGLQSVTFEKETYDDRNDIPFCQRFQGPVDTVSVSDPSQMNILQNVNVYELTEPLKDREYYSRTEVKHGSKRITKGVPVVNGSDSLSFDFTAEFGKKYLELSQTYMEDFDKYREKFPGIYITTNDPIGEGGRFNMFHMDILENTSSSYVARTDNFAVLYYSGMIGPVINEYRRGERTTTLGGRPHARLAS